MDIGSPGELGAAGIGDDQRGAAYVRALDRRAEHGVRFGRVGAGDEDDVRGVLHLAHRAGGRRRVERPLHRRDRGRMAQPGAVVDVVGAERSAEQPHEEVVLFIGALGRGEAGERVAAARAFDAQQLLRGELEGLVPGRLAERLVPRRRRSPAVADVQVEPLEQRQLAQRLADRARRARRLRGLAFTLDRLPRPAAAFPARRPAPRPATALLYPPLPNQRLGEPVAMLREVVAEPSLHARRALIRSVQLDIGRRDPEDLVVGHVQVDLTPDTAVGAHGPDHAVRTADALRRKALLRHYLEDRTGGADAYALAAPGAAGLVRVAVGADDDLGVLSPLGHVQHSHDLNVFARAYTPRAQHAGAHVVANHRVAGPFVTVAQRQVAPARRRRHDTVAHDVPLELVAGLGAPAVDQMVARIALEQQPQHAPPVLHRRVGLGVDHHPVCHLRGACRQQLRLSLDRDQTNAAVSDDGELGIPAQRGDVVDSGSPGGVEDRLVGLGGDATAVDDEAGHAVKINPGAVRGNPKCLPHRAVWTCLKRDRAGRGPARCFLSRYARASGGGCGRPPHPRR